MVNPTWGQGSQSQAREALVRAFPEVQVREVNGRVRQVYGVPMTRGQTARAAVADWMERYSAALTGQALDLVEYSQVETKSGKTMLRYTQRIGEVPVKGSMIVAVTVGEGEQQTLTYIACRLADSPSKPFPAPAVGAAGALAAARAHPAGQALTEWREPELVTTFEEDREGGAPADLVWRCVGQGGTESYDSRTFYVDPAEGVVVREFSNAVGFDVTGTVRAWLTPGLKPDPWGKANVDPPTGTILCPNSVQSGFPLRSLRVIAKNHSTGLPISGAEAYTDEDGDFTVPLASGLTVDLEFSLVGPYWQVYDNMLPGASLPGLPAPVETVASVSSTASLPSPVVFNIPDGLPVQVPPSSSETRRTAHVNGFAGVEHAWRYYTDRIVVDEKIDGLQDMVTVSVNSRQQVGNAKAWPGDSIIEFGHQWLDGTSANTAYSTWLAHEYGHYLLYYIADIDPVDPLWQLAFHEGFADSLAQLSYDDPDNSDRPAVAWGADWGGCDLPSREPLDPRRSYPLCSAGEEHEVGTILSGIWLDVYNELESTYGVSTAKSIVRQMQVDWTFLTTGGESNDIACDPPPTGLDKGRSVTCGTLIEVLTADDDDNNLSNGTPHDDEIEAAFATHGLPGTICGDAFAATLPPSSPDCDHNGSIDLHDTLCFQMRFAAGDPGADCDRDGRLTLHDFACFMDAVRRGAHR